MYAAAEFGRWWYKSDWFVTNRLANTCILFMPPTTRRHDDKTYNAYMHVHAPPYARHTQPNTALPKR